MMKEKTNPRIVDTIVERPHLFKVGETVYHLHQPCLGKVLIVSPLYQTLGLDRARLFRNTEAEVYRVTKEHREAVCQIIAIHSAPDKAHVFDEDFMTTSTETFDKLESKELATLLYYVLTSDSVEYVIHELGIDTDDKMREKVSRVKKDDKSSVTFGGRSIYGSLIDFACERYGWTYEYVLWGISYANLRLLMRDATTTSYLSEEERRKAHLSTDGISLRADDPANSEYIKTLLND